MTILLDVLVCASEVVLVVSSLLVSAPVREATLYAMLDSVDFLPFCCEATLLLMLVSAVEWLDCEKRLLVTFAEVEVASALAWVTMLVVA